MTKNQDLVKLLDEIAKARREKAMLCYADGGNEDDRPIEDYADFQAARAIESLEEEVERLKTAEENACKRVNELDRALTKSIVTADRRVAEERERCETIVSNLHRIISEPYVDPSDKYNTPEAIGELHGNLVFIALDAIRARSNGSEQSPGSSIGRAVDAHEVSGSIPDPVSAPVQEITPVGGGASLALIPGSNIGAAMLREHPAASEFNPDWTLTDIEKVIVALTLALPKHVPGWPGCTDEQMEAVARAAIGDVAHPSPAVTVEELHGRIAWIIEQRLAVPADEAADAAKSVLSEEMLRAAMDAVYGPAAHKNISDDGCKSIDDDNDDAYRAMYAAAPTPTVSNASATADIQKGVTSDPTSKAGGV